MARPRTKKVEEVKRRLITRLQEGFFRPGDRFLSTRLIAEKFAVSFQTAHRLARELCEEGLLERRSASGTYIPGTRGLLRGVDLLFHERAKRADSFGARLLEELTARLDRERVPWKLRWVEGTGGPDLPPRSYPVIWECRAAVEACAAAHRPALLLNDRPPSGIAAVSIDSVSTDDFSGGACAAQVFQRRAEGPSAGGFAIVAGPEGDERSDQRVGGFRSLLKATVFPAGWYFEDGQRVAGAALARGTRGIFCCNDRLAEAILDRCAERGVPCPPLVGFDDAPVAERLNLTTIAIPWAELVSAAARVIQRRLGGDRATASHQTFAPRPVVRGT